MVALLVFMLISGFVLWRFLMTILPAACRKSPIRRFVLLLSAIIFMQPFVLWPPAFYIRGITGDFSLSTCLLVSDAICCQFLRRTLLSGHEKRFILILLALTGSVFYPFSLGIGRLDPYALGFGSYWLVACLLGIGVFCLLRHWTASGCALGLAMLAWSFGFYESDNLWDYVIDPWAWFYALSVIFQRATGWFKKFRRFQASTVKQ